MKTRFILLMMIVAFCAEAQNDTTFLKSWEKTTKDKSDSYRIISKNSDNTFAYRIYTTKTNAPYSSGTYSDTIKKMHVGTATLYFDNGAVEDSSIYDHEGNLVEIYHYYPTKTLAYRYVPAKNGNKKIEEAFDESGNKSKDYIYGREAKFKGGDKAWIKYISEHATKEFSSSAIKEDVMATVRVQFIVDKEGYVTNPKVVLSSGEDAMDKEAVRIIMSSPRWNNAVQYNKPVKAYRLQPITFVIVAKK